MAKRAYRALCQQHMLMLMKFNNEIQYPKDGKRYMYNSERIKKSAKPFYICVTTDNNEALLCKTLGALQ